MGKGKLARFEENKRLENVFEPSIEELQIGYPLRGNWAEKFFKNNEELTLELGCGKGEYTVGLARLYKNHNFLGVDIKGARLWRGAKTGKEENLKNVGFVRTHIGNLPMVFGKNEVAQIWLPCPDPQMKRARKRLTGSFFLNRYQEFLKEDGLIHLKTDSNFMFQYTKAIVQHNHLNILECSDNIYANEPIKAELQIRTFYESQFLERGIPSKYICFELPHKKIEEPKIEIPKDEYRSFGRC